MCETISKQREFGGALLGTLFIILFLGMLGMSLATLISADARMQALDVDERRAFYAAHSGIEYAIRYTLAYALNQPLSGFGTYTETLNTGGNTTCDLQIVAVGSDSMRISAFGRSGLSSKNLNKTYNYVDVSQYAVYSSGDVSRTTTIPANSIYENAEFMPVFDLDILRNLARPTQYYTSDVDVDASYGYTRTFFFCEEDITFEDFSWSNTRHFIAEEDVELEYSSLGSTAPDGVIFVPIEGSEFSSEWNLSGRELEGGLICNGDVTGTDRNNRPYRFTVRHNRATINQLMQYSVNESPVVFTGMHWRN